MREKFITRTVERSLMTCEFLRKDTKEFFKIAFNVFGVPEENEFEKLALDALAHDTEYGHLFDICVLVDTRIEYTTENKYKMSIEKFVAFSDLVL